MSKRSYKTFLAAATALSMAVSGTILPVEQLTPVFSVEAYAAGTGSVNTDRLNVRSGPGTSYSKVTTLGAGTQVSIDSEVTGSDGYTWYGISFAGGSGFARYDFISKNVTHAAASADFEYWLNNQGFPESYKNGLRGLHNQYPNWVFTAQHTGLDWETVISEESRIGRNLVADDSISSWKSIGEGAFDWANNYWPGFDGASWVQASEGLIRYYMDPRNFLTDPYVFQFERQTYNPSVQTREGLMNLISGTFLDSDAIVPVEGSQIEGGTIIEGSVWEAGASYSGSGVSSSGGSAAGPGPGTASGSSGGYMIIGPGQTAGMSSGGDTGAGPGGLPQDNGNNYYNADDVVVIGKADKAAGIWDRIAGLADLASGTIDAYAGKWRSLTEPDVHWVYVDDDGSLLKDGWFWLDGNRDGIAECYYFDAEGRMAADTVIEGYYVNADGKWAETDGHIHTKNVSVDASTSESTAGTVSNGSENSQSTYTDGSQTGQNTYSDGTQNVQSASGQMKRVPYADIIMKAAEVSGVSPYVLASSILQEQGKGTSDLISGRHSQYPGYYNFYNTGAYAHDGMSAVEAGLKYASESGNGGRPWNTIEKAIIGGASAYGASYVNNGQDTFYLKKFNVQGSNKFNHQFMTHVLAAASEGAKVSNAYSSAVKGGALEFKIPVYTNMPETPASLPAGDGNPNNKLSSLSVDGYSLTPSFGMDTADYSLIVDGSAAVVNITAQTIDPHATVSGAGNVALNVGNNEIYVTVRAENGSERNYHLSITRREYYGADQGTGSVSYDANTANAAAGPGIIYPAQQETIPAQPAVTEQQTAADQQNVSQPQSAEQVQINNTVTVGPGMNLENLEIPQDNAAFTNDTGGVIIGVGPQ